MIILNDATMFISDHFRPVYLSKLVRRGGVNSPYPTIDSIGLQTNIFWVLTNKRTIILFFKTIHFQSHQTQIKGKDDISFIYFFKIDLLSSVSPHSK